MKSEGSQHIYNSLKKTRKVDLGNKVVDRIMQEVGTIKYLEKDEVKNYILIPNRVEGKDGKKYTSSWSVHEIHPDDTTNFRYNEDEDKWNEKVFAPSKTKGKE